MLPIPPPGPDAAVARVRNQVGDLHADEPTAAPDLRGRQTADAARHNEVLPVAHHGATRLSPYIRYWLIELPTAWDAAAGAPARDRTKIRDTLA